MTGDSAILAPALQDRSTWRTNDHCPVVKAMEVVGTRSAIIIIREALYGTTRFDDFAERVGISEPAAARRLRELVDAELLEREDYREPGQRTRQSYRLTQKGADLFPVLVALMEWGDRWCNGGSGPIELAHAGCGAPVGVELRCAEGHVVTPIELLAARRAGQDGDRTR